MAFFESHKTLLIGLKGEDSAISQDLTAAGFTPVANTYYKHSGTTGLYKSGVMYFYDGSSFLEVVVKNKIIRTYYISSGAATLNVQPNTEYYYPTLSSLTLTFANGNLGDMFYIEFSSGSTPTDIIFDNVSNAVWDTDFTVEANKSVEICGKWNGEKWIILMTQL